MASSSENDDKSSGDSDDDSVFYDASSTVSTSEVTSSLAQEPRWRISSKNDPLKSPKQRCPVPLTENQLNDIQKRDKLQRLRAQDNPDNRNSPKSTAKTPSELTSLSSVKEQGLTDGGIPSAPDLLKDHIENERTRRPNQHSASSLSKQTLINSAPETYHQRSLPYIAVPATSARGTGGNYFSRKSVSSNNEANAADLNTIDHLTKFGEFFPNSPKLNDDGKYMPLIDANPMTQTIMERVHRSGSVTTSRRNSVHILRKNSSETSSLTQSEIDLSRFNQQNNEYDDDDDDESTSSGCSSTKSSVTKTESSSSTISKSSTSARATIKRQLNKMALKNFFRRRKNKTTDNLHETTDLDDEEDDGERLLINDGSNGDLKYKASRYLKDQTRFDRTQLLQTIVNAHEGPIWCMKFSPDGHLLATGGQDSLLKIWVLKSTQPYFNDCSRLTSNTSKQQNEVLTTRFNEFHQAISSEPITSTINAKLGLHEAQAPLYARPFCELLGHQAPVLDVAWSKSLFLLSSSMDKTVRLWHLSRLECLCFFRHVDFVSAIAFHPRDDRYFVSASLDGHVRLWNIPDKRVVHWTLIPAHASSQITAAQANLITAVNFCDDGRKVTVGTFDGRFLQYTDSLQYDTVMNIGDADGSRSHRSRKKRRKPFKITGIESMNSNNSKVLITSNDSRIRLYNIRSKEIERKYRGYSNQSSQIRASFSHDDQFIISGSEDSWFYIWRTEPNINGNTASNNSKLTRKQRRYFGRAFERIRVHNTMVTSAIFAPNPTSIMNYIQSSHDPSPSISHSNTPASTPNVNINRTRSYPGQSSSNYSDGISATTHTGPIYVMVTADSKGQLKLLVNRYYR